ncbi:MAG: ChbG/HpnK family deacetylase [Caldimonas sp.]
MTRRLALCADDFGRTPAISDTIVELAGAGRLGAVSCLVNGPHWPAAALSLRGCVDRVDLGLHFNLTEGRPLSPELARIWPELPALPRLIAMAHFERLPRAALALEFAAQLDAFTAATGAAPALVDAHQHVHHLPGVRTIVLDAIGRIAPRPAVRNTGRVIGPGFAVKRALIERTGGRQLLAQLRSRGFAHNAALTGVYDFGQVDYRALMRGWLAALPVEGAMLFCHPGAASSEGAADPIAAARVREAAYLRSAAFGADLAEAHVELGPVWRAAPA